MIRMRHSASSRLVGKATALTAGRFGLAKSFLSSGFLAALSGRCSGDPSDLEEAAGGDGDKPASVMETYKRATSQYQHTRESMLRSIDYAFIA